MWFAVGILQVLDCGTDNHTQSLPFLTSMVHDTGHRINIRLVLVDCLLPHPGHVNCQEETSAESGKVWGKPKASPEIISSSEEELLGGRELRKASAKIK
ncbi:restriction endonuclease [Sesbania bispinosa]|nr:restriction endonuclease [Sesbania bispinosa]